MIYPLTRIYAAGNMSRVSTLAFSALAEPARRDILDLLREGERSVSDLVAALPMTQPGVSKHLRVLREAGLVDVRPEAQRRIYGVRPEPLAELDAWLAPYRRLWSRRLDALERHLDDHPQEEQR
jgi:DNA-binding transcriptional ArsR family regulator